MDRDHYHDHDYGHDRYHRDHYHRHGYSDTSNIGFIFNLVSIIATITGVIRFIVHALVGRRTGSTGNQYYNTVSSSRASNEDIQNATRKTLGLAPIAPAEPQKVSCDYCGLQLDQSWAECPNCGTRVR